MNVFRKKLKECAQNTGYDRRGKCANIEDDEYKHQVCFKSIDRQFGKNGDFCDITHQSDWCAKEHQDWCVCRELYNGAANEVNCDDLKINCDATNLKVLETYTSDEKYKKGLECLIQHCPKASEQVKQLKKVRA